MSHEGRKVNYILFSLYTTPKDSIINGSASGFQKKFRINNGWLFLKWKDLLGSILFAISKFNDYILRSI